jgi:hypothetical protein
LTEKEKVTYMGGATKREKGKVTTVMDALRRGGICNCNN